MAQKKIWLALLVALLPGCAWLQEGSMGQAQIKNFETRKIDAALDAVYLAATEALFDLGYVIRHSEKAAGIIVGERQETRNEWISSKENQPAHFEERRTVHALTLLMRSAGKKATDVRIQTSEDGQVRFNKSAIDKVWLFIDRQTLMASPAPATPPKR